MEEKQRERLHWLTTITRIAKVAVLSFAVLMLILGMIAAICAGNNNAFYDGKFNFGSFLIVFILVAVFDIFFTMFSLVILLLIEILATYCAVNTNDKKPTSIKSLK